MLTSRRISPMVDVKSEDEEEALTRRLGVISVVFLDLKETRVLTWQTLGNWDGSRPDGGKERFRGCRNCRVCAHDITAIVSVFFTPVLPSRSCFKFQTTERK